MNRIYLDYAATTPIKPEVLKVMEETFRNVYGNPGSLHMEGQKAIAVIDSAREIIAKAVGAEFRGVIFMGSATEANNSALRGIVNHKQSGKKPRIIISAVEHESVLETVKDLEREGAELIILPVDKMGVINLKKLRESLNERTVLVSVMYVNNEIGTVQPIAEISKIIGEFKKSIHSSSTHYSLCPYGTSPTGRQTIPKLRSGSRQNVGAHYPLFHTDAVQAFRYLPCNIQELGVDLMTISAHKIYGPKGVGALCVRQLQTTNYSLQPIITGGGQEFGLRSGTENVPLIAGFAKAVELADKNREKEAKRIDELKIYFWKGIKKLYPSSAVNGPDFPHTPSPDNSIELSYGRRKAAPHILNVRFPGVSAEEFLIKLDMLGVAVSAGSACSMRSAKPSHVLEAIGLTPKQAKESLRFSFGDGTTKREIDGVLGRIGAKI
ncbi:MAG: cysteine desulfurase family protein [Candidatus Jorgensenbacteria bacterium]|nr:cysteine desulfurase family protein [Candidatus Jorgensenbacteria bacterium]